MNTDSLERIVPDSLHIDEATGSETYRLHMERYEFALNHAVGFVMDAACGVGYGSFHLAQSEKISGIAAVDIDADAIAYANSRYKHSKVQFINSDILAFTTAKQPDSIVSLETIEHVPDPVALINYFFKLLKPGGVFIASVPVTPSVDANPHHLTDFTTAGFEKMLKRAGFVVKDKRFQIQPFSPISIATGKEKRAKNIRPSLPIYYLKNPVSLLKRVWSTLRFGFTNRYLTVVAEKPL
jgi:SAM-dependent methyltransferase